MINTHTLTKRERESTILAIRQDPYFTFFVINIPQSYDKKSRTHITPIYVAHKTLMVHHICLDL